MTLEELIGNTLHAIFEYTHTHPGVLNAALTDEAIIDAEGAQAVPLVQQWGYDWGATLMKAASVGQHRAVLRREHHRPGHRRLPSIRRPAKPRAPNATATTSCAISRNSSCAR